LEDIENTAWDKLDWMEKMSMKHDERRLIQALTELGGEDADLVRLKHLEGWSFDEIAQKIGKSPGALRTQSHRALKSLRNILKQK
jgi:RNA polymerase sigma factor (sigma-70 family)